jgi:hypothetical protein
MPDLPACLLIVTAEVDPAADVPAQPLELFLRSSARAAMPPPGFGGAADLTRPRGSESALQRRARGCALPRSPAADTRSHRCG